MKKVIALLCSTMILCACTSKKESEITLFNDITFKLIEGERSVNINAKAKENFHFYTSEHTSIQMPLFKNIESEYYTIYIGIPINTSIKQLAALKSSHIDNPLSFNTDEASYLYISHYNRNKYISEYCKKIDNNTIYVLTVSHTPETSDTLFNMEALSKRFNQE